MKKEVVTCDICSTEIDANTGDYVTLFLKKNGQAIKRVDFCAKCANEAIKRDDAEAE